MMSGSSVHPRFTVVFARDSYAELLQEAVEGACVVVASRRELLLAIAKPDPVVVFVELDLLRQLEGEVDANVTVVGIVDDGLDDVIGAIDSFPWLAHVVTTAMLSSPSAAAQMAALWKRLEPAPEQLVLVDGGSGRAALLTSSARREARFERLRSYFEMHGLGNRMISSIQDIAEELVTNALYDAPTEAGYFTAPVARTASVDLPPEHACEISYGIDHGSAFVRIRDPFGALTRSRLLGVLHRCNQVGVPLDESRGGAGLGLWRVFSSASTIAITVIPGRLTDISVSVSIDAKKGRPGSKPLHAVHLVFPRDHELDGAQSRFAAEHDYDLIDESFTALLS